jgi:D-glycero-D-manno-heptose 1,7-bisphosphate phosphatase
MFPGIPFVRPGGAVFIDRDGVISEQKTHVNRPEDLRLIDGAAEAIARLNRAEIPVVVITNQGGIAMGHLTEQTLHVIHAHMKSLLAEHGAHVAAIYYCPHHPQGTRTAYLLDCPCRKPGIGMLEKARDDLGIDLPHSVLVGDATTDILAGVRAGCRTILVQTGFGGNDGKAVAQPDAIVADLLAAVDLILGAQAN